MIPEVLRRYRVAVLVGLLAFYISLKKKRCPPEAGSRNPGLGIRNAGLAEPILRFLNILRAHLILILGGTVPGGLWNQEDYQDQIDLDRIQATLLSTEHLNLGRVEKRTLFVKRLEDVFPNDLLREKLIQAARMGVKTDSVILPMFLEPSDKWHVLNACTNHVSELFPQSHLYFNEARRNPSFYRSAWYLFTMTCTRTSGRGRFFITPSKAVVGEADVGQLCMRIVLVSEPELRMIASGELEAPPKGFFNERHRGRWKVLQKFAQLFVRQLEDVTGENFETAQHWGPNLCGTLNPSALERRKDRGKQKAAPIAAEIRAEDNCFLRIHIPYPGGIEKMAGSACQDVVLYS